MFLNLLGESHPMTTIQNILFPVDFSPSCVAMAAYVKRVAAISGARVTLIHVFDLYSHDAIARSEIVSTSMGGPNE